MTLCYLLPAMRKSLSGSHIITTSYADPLSKESPHDPIITATAKSGWVFPPSPSWGGGDKDTEFFIINLMEVTRDKTRMINCVFVVHYPLPSLESLAAWLVPKAQP